MMILLIRSVILYLVTLLAVKAMGKRQVAQLQPFDLVVVLIISDMASLCMQSRSNPLMYSIVPIVTISLMQVGISLINMKSRRSRDLFCGRPVMLIEKGRLCEDNLRRMRININDLQELCRAQGYFDISGIDYALMETNGSLSVLPRTEKRPLQVDDLLPEPPQEILPCLLILDGCINHSQLSRCGYDRQWLEQQLKKCRQVRIEDTFVAGLDDQGSFFAQPKQRAQCGSRRAKGGRG